MRSCVLMFLVCGSLVAQEGQPILTYSRALLGPRFPDETEPRSIRIGIFPDGRVDLILNGVKVDGWGRVIQGSELTQSVAALVADRIRAMGSKADIINGNIMLYGRGFGFTPAMVERIEGLGFSAELTDFVVLPDGNNPAHVELLGLIYLLDDLFIAGNTDSSNGLYVRRARTSDWLSHMRGTDIGRVRRR